MVVLREGKEAQKLMVDVLPSYQLYISSWDLVLTGKILYFTIMRRTYHQHRLFDVQHCVQCIGK